jgi:hypothetical protein
MAYMPRPELASQIAHALEPQTVRQNVASSQPGPGDAAASFLNRLEEEIPAKWLLGVRRLYAETAPPKIDNAMTT